MRIENWSYAKGFDLCTPDKEMQGCLWGQVFGHPNHYEGENIRTSRVVAIENGMVVTFSGSRYELGEPSPDYEKAFPNCKARLLGQI